MNPNILSAYLTLLYEDAFGSFAGSEDVETTYVKTKGFVLSSDKTGTFALNLDKTGEFTVRVNKSKIFRISSE